MLLEFTLGRECPLAGSRGAASVCLGQRDLPMLSLVMLTAQWLSTFLMLQPFNTVPRAVVTPQP